MLKDQTTRDLEIKDLFGTQRKHLDYFFEQLDTDIADAVFRILLRCEGTIIVTGVGKSGIIAEKIASTMTSVGVRARHLLPTEAAHGDLGLVEAGDVVLLFSKSGESEELLTLIPSFKQKGAQPIAVVSNLRSRLAKACSLAVELPLQNELCPFDLAPTTSPTLQLLFGDVLAVALMRARGFTVKDYALNHPSGSIGKRMTVTVQDLMLREPEAPLCLPSDKLGDALVLLTNRRCGCVVVVDANRKLQGIFTDGDLRRALQQHGADVVGKPLAELMTATARWVEGDSMAWDALKLMESDQDHPITVLPVLDSSRCVVGLIKMHDILQAGV